MVNWSFFIFRIQCIIFIAFHHDFHLKKNESMVGMFILGWLSARPFAGSISFEKVKRYHCSMFLHPPT